MKLILASTSKFKNEILDIVHMKHLQLASDFVEESKSCDVYDYVEDLAYGKAKSVVKKVDEGIVLGIDTVVYANGKILEKPKSLGEAKDNLKKCSNGTTSVITGVCLINVLTKEVIRDFCETKITLRNIDEEDLNYYVENESNVLYASGFIVETIVSNFIETIEGSYYNILGVPVETIYKHIYDMGYKLKDLES